VSGRGGFGSFLLGLGIGAMVGFLFAPETGDATRSKLRDLRDLATEKAGELGEILDAGDAGDADEEPPAREALQRRLGEAKQRRRARTPARLAAPEEEDEPVA
jgi:gas vesicle protein